MKRSTPVLILGAILGILPTVADARVFTDDQGRTTEAELAGVQENDVVLWKQGLAMRWPLAKLSSADQAYVREWQANPAATPHIGVRIWERQGLSPAGSFSDDQPGQPGLPNIPGVMELEKRATFHHYDIDLTNMGKTQANAVTVSYQIYVITASGQVVTEVAAEVAPPLNPDQRITVATKAVSLTRTKTSSLRLSAGVFGGVSTSQKTSRSTEKFGGAWVRAYSHDGKVVGEAKDLDPELERMKPAWVAPTTAEAPALEGGLDQFDTFVAQMKERLAKIQEVLKSLPPLPEPKDGATPPKPPRPPGLPPFPR